MTYADASPFSSTLRSILSVYSGHGCELFR